ncbi:MAG: LytR C-terminal domain-containing protein [Balneolaceae bacterium]|nr:LytR C-terminal domain-containing protein [Balneolaceae bacterium]MDR9447193.1 LytR C-terminal domain-containing protein [Balneolaceae bacterium]
MSEKRTSPEASSPWVTVGLTVFTFLFVVLLSALVLRFLVPRIDVERAKRSEKALIGNVIQVEVLNGGGIEGAANTVTTSLRHLGFDVVEIGNFDVFDVEQTVVLARDGGDVESAERVARGLGLSDDRVLIEESADYYLDVTVLVGRDYESLTLERP